MLYNISNMNREKLRAVDLFCGCGGIASGLEKSGVEVLAGVDIENKYLCSFAHNFPGAHSFNLDLSAVSPCEMRNLLGVEIGELFLVAGGPPCQGFSKNVPRRERFLADPRNLLVKSFLDHCKYLRPQWILLENVAEMKNGFEQTYTEEIICRLSKVGYKVTYGVLNAADYGVPQRRKRAFFVANRIGIEFEFPEKTHEVTTAETNLFALPSHVSVWNAIGDLPDLEHGEGEINSSYIGEPTNSFQREIRDNGASVKNHVARILQPKQYSRLAALKPGQGLKDLPPHLQTKGGYSGAYGRLTKEMIAPTITRWVFHPGSGRWGHPVDIRTLSIREIARLQSFPDSYEFVGSFNDMAGQLGNAVPPLLAHQIVAQILRQTPSSRESMAMNRSNVNFCDAAGQSKVMA